MAVFGYYVDNDRSLCTQLLAVKRIRGNHGGENIARSLLKVINDLFLRDKISYFQLDNASSNDVAITAVLRDLRPELSDGELTTLVKQSRARYFGYILNVLARALIKGDYSRLIRSLEAGLQARLSAKEEAKYLKNWRKSGPIGKLHYII